MAQAKYFEAPEVEEIAVDLIEKYHQHLSEYSVKIRYVFSDKTPNSKGKEVWGTCRKVSGLNAYLEGNSPDGESFFVITISKEIWDILPKDKKIALVDHELCHAWAEVKQKKDDSDSDEELETDNPVKLGIKPHDLEEFSCIVRRHGLWRDDIQEFVEAALKTKPKENKELT
jgi:predicted metallopeptidase